jgi:hypothetical protein
MFLTARIKKMMVWIVTVAALQITWADSTTPATPGPTSVADTTAEGYLQQIATYTNGTMVAVNNIPSYLLTITEAMYAWLNPDTSSTTANLQGAFSTYYSSIDASVKVQPIFGAALTTDLLNGASASTLPNANDVSYETLLGTKILNPDPRDANGGTPTDSVYNYIKNASGGSITHVMPNSSWNGTAGDQAKYNGYYNTVMTAETYNAYTLSQLATDIISGIPANQKALTDMANGSSFFSQVASEGAGIVLRQILMFESQSFIVLTEILKTEKQLLATQAMTNTLLINNGVTSEQILLRKAIIKTQAM